MMIGTRHLWLLFLPLMAFISVLLRESPELVDGKIFPNVSTEVSANNFFVLEEALSRLYVVRKNRLIIDAQTEKYLSQLLNRKKFFSGGSLIEKTFPTSQGKQLLQLISCYLAFKQDEQRISKLYASLKPNQLLDYRNLQHTFFGDISQDLFIEHHNFYQNAQESGLQLVVPLQDNVSVPEACIRMHNVE